MWWKDCPTKAMVEIFVSVSVVKVGKGVSFTAGFGKSTSAWLPKIMEDDEADGKDADVGKANAAPLDMSALHKLIAEVRSVG